MKSKIHLSFFQINQIKLIDDIIKVMQLNQIDWNSRHFLKTKIFTHILCYSLNQNSVNYFNLMKFMLSVLDFLY